MDVNHEIARFDLSLPIEKAPTPPSSWYTAADFLRREKETLFSSCWQAVGRVEQVARPGDYFSGRFLGQPYLVCRDEQGTLRAHYNVCRHHASVVADEQGCEAAEFVCPYHGWSYHLDGRLKSAPRLGAVKEFDRSEYGLKPLQVTTWGPLVFVRFGTEGQDLSADLAPLEKLVIPNELSQLRFVARRSYDLKCNWKVYVDNYLDGGYHVERCHPELAAQLDLGAYQTRVEPHLVLQTVKSDTGDERVGGGAVYAWLYPNFMLNRYGPILDTNWVIPLGPDRCRTVFDYYFEESHWSDEEFIERSIAASHQVQLEDVAICEAVQAGLESDGYDVGRYAPGLEVGEYAFHHWLAADLKGSLLVAR